MSDRIDPALGPDRGHEYDGIRELDNRLPNWWLWTLLITVVFGYGYWMWFHVLTDTEKGAWVEYRAEMDAAQAAADAAALARGAPTDEGLAALAADAGKVADGKALFVQYCAACHGPEGAGLIGPNLTDGHYLHERGRPVAMRQVIAAGVAAKGMPAWEPVLGPSRVDQLTSFVLSIRGKNLPGKAPEGEPAAAPDRPEGSTPTATTAP